MYNNVPKKSKSLYLLGLLCLWPTTGGFVALGLLFYAIFYNKDKWLAIIGAFGIVFTIAINLFVYLFISNSPINRKNSENASQNNLDLVAKRIEYYKQQYGHYPDNLQQLKKAYPLAPVKDIIIFRGFYLPEHYYNYERVGGDKYILFSSGLDDMPNTADDLYPSSPYRNIGWIRSK